MEISSPSPEASSDRFPAREFDDWAPTYDQDVQAGAGFPFEGYAQVLQAVCRLADARPGMRVLDVGAGTGGLALRFARLGCQVWAADFSAAMLGRARLNLPHVPLVQADLRQDLPFVPGASFDRIVSAYVFHHFELPEKVRILARLCQHLAPQGRLVVADLAFANRQARQSACQAAGAAWEEEFYWTAETDLPALAQAGLAAQFHPISIYSGVFTIQRL